MRVLAFDTALGACSAAIWADGSVCARAFMWRDRGQAEILLPMVQSVCAEAGMAFGELDRLAVTVGPGSFVGTRVGLAAARGLALATGLPLVGVTTLEAVAFGLEPSPGGIMVAAFDAHRAELYVQSFGPGLAMLDQAAALTPDAAAERIGGGPALLAGTGASRLAEELARRGVGHEIACGREQPDAALVAALAAQRTPEARAPAPLYLRPPDARLPAKAL